MARRFATMTCPRAFSGRRRLSSVVGLRQEVMVVFDRTFAITGVLRMLTMLVAFVGILSALMAMQVERARELAVMRAVGLTPGQVWGVICGETAIIGTIAGVLSLPLGIIEALVLIYVHFPPIVRATIHRKLLSGLRPGGLLILEAFHPNQLGHASGGPKDLTMLYTLELLRSDLASVPDAVFEELTAWEGETRLDEGPGHCGDAQVTRLVARRIAKSP